MVVNILVYFVLGIKKTEIILMTEHKMKELIKIQSELKVSKSQRNLFGKYNYRSCEDILEGVKPLLTANGCILTLSDEVVLIGERYYIKSTATITNSEAQSISTTAYARESLDKKGMDSAQISGAASSYSRKYCLNGLLAIDDTKDADTQDNTKQQVPQQKSKTIDDIKQIEALRKEINILYETIGNPAAQLKSWMDNLGKHNIAQLQNGLKSLKEIK